MLHTLYAYDKRPFAIFVILKCLGIIAKIFKKIILRIITYQEILVDNLLLILLSMDYQLPWEIVKTIRNIRNYSENMTQSFVDVLYAYFIKIE